jgi:hypothetical protein
MIHPEKWQGKRFHMIATLLMPTAHKVQGNEEGECNCSICYKEVICLSWMNLACLGRGKDNHPQARFLVTLF